MGCYKCEKGHSHENYQNKDDKVKYHHDNCVADVVRSIVKAQRHAEEVEEDTCLTGCERSIEDLLSPCENDKHRPTHDTIPFMLYCKGGCNAFIGSGVTRERRHFECVESPIFKAKAFVGGNCVRLELLLPVHDGPHHGEHGEEHDRYHGGAKGDVCDFFNGSVCNFRATGICLTVDLDCFCGITCLDPITPDHD